ALELRNGGSDYFGKGSKGIILALFALELRNGGSDYFGKGFEGIILALFAIEIVLESGSIKQAHLDIWAGWVFEAYMPEIYLFVATFSSSYEMNLVLNYENLNNLFLRATAVISLPNFSFFEGSTGTESLNF
ncbi:hypothetical protein ACJX0J_033381, partial [Zea mays]